MGSLEENFRMNEDLCELPRQLYGSNYRPMARNKDWKLASVGKVDSQVRQAPSHRLTTHQPLPVSQRECCRSIGVC
jgi:hypothetical protein